MGLLQTLWVYTWLATGGHTLHNLSPEGSICKSLVLAICWRLLIKRQFCSVLGLCWQYPKLMGEWKIGLRLVLYELGFTVRSSISLLVQEKKSLLVHSPFLFLVASKQPNANRQSASCLHWQAHDLCMWMVLWYVFSGVLVWTQIISDAQLKRLCLDPITSYVLAAATNQQMLLVIIVANEIVVCFCMHHL